MEHLVLLKSSRREESFATGCTEKCPGHFFLRLVGVESDHVPLEIGRHPDSLPAEVTVGVLSLGVFHHMELQLVFEVEHLATDLALQFSTYFVFGSDVNIAPPSLGISLLTNSALELSVYLREKNKLVYVIKERYKIYFLFSTSSMY